MPLCRPRDSHTRPLSSSPTRTRRPRAPSRARRLLSWHLRRLRVSRRRQARVAQVEVTRSGLRPPSTRVRGLLHRHRHLRPAFIAASALARCPCPRPSAPRSRRPTIRRPRRHPSAPTQAAPEEAWPPCAPLRSARGPAASSRMRATTAAPCRLWICPMTSLYRGASHSRVEARLPLAAHPRVRATPISTARFRRRCRLRPNVTPSRACATPQARPTSAPRRTTTSESYKHKTSADLD